MTQLQDAGGLSSLIFPTYNPGPVLDRIWGSLVEFLGAAPGSWEVLFVCDGCSDNTPQHLERLAASAPPVRVVSYPHNRGKGHAVRFGLEQARGQRRIFTDIDLSSGFDGVLRVDQKLREGFEVAIGSRRHPDSAFHIPNSLMGYIWRRRIQSWVFSRLVRWMLPITFRDTQCGLKGFSARAVATLLPHLHCDGFAFDCELLVRSQQAGFEVAEVPVLFRFFDEVSTTTFRKSLRMIREIWRIRRRCRRSPEVPLADPPSADVSRAA